MNEFRTINQKPDRLIVLTKRREDTLLDLHRKIKGTYLQLTALLDDLDLLCRK